MRAGHLKHPRIRPPQQHLPATLRPRQSIRDHSRPLNASTSFAPIDQRTPSCALKWKHVVGGSSPKLTGTASSPSSAYTQRIVETYSRSRYHARFQMSPIVRSLFTMFHCCPRPRSNPPRRELAYTNPSPAQHTSVRTRLVGLSISVHTVPL